MAASAGIVVTASFLVERSGPFLGAMIATLPISAGPAYVVLALEHGPDFIAQSSIASLSVNAGTVLFLTLYARIAPHHGPLASLAICFALWIACATAIIGLSPPLAGVLALNAAAFTIGFIALRSGKKPAGGAAQAGAALVGRARARARGDGNCRDRADRRTLARPAPPASRRSCRWITSLAVILHPRIGGEATSVVFAHSLPGMVGFALSLLVLHFRRFSSLRSARPPRSPSPWPLALPGTECSSSNVAGKCARRSHGFCRSRFYWPARLACAARLFWIARMRASRPTDHARASLRRARDARQRGGRRGAGAARGRPEHDAKEAGGGVHAQLPPLLPTTKAGASSACET